LPYVMPSPRYPDSGFCSTAPSNLFNFNFQI